MKWNYEPFYVPEEVLKLWRDAGSRNKQNYQRWIETKENKVKSLLFKKDDFLMRDYRLARKESTQYFLGNPKEIATRKSSEIVLSHIMKQELNLLGGSADLTGSNNTYVKEMSVINKQSFKGNYITLGSKRTWNGCSYEWNFFTWIFYTLWRNFLVFSDYCRPAIRLSALMKQKVIYVFTHDSIGLGEDGPTHQPIEHLSALRVIPNLNVFRPCDAIETSECWELALLSENTPSVIALSRQNLPLLRNSSQ